MVATNDLAHIDRHIRVVLRTMESARHFEQDWPKHPQLMLDEIGRQFEPFVKVFGRPINQQLKTSLEINFKAIVVSEKWHYVPEQPQYVICYGLGWTLVNVTENVAYPQADSTLVELLGGKRFGMGGMSLFIDACSYRISELLRERRELLAQLESECLLDQMMKAFEPSHYGRARRFIDELESSDTPAS